MPFERGNFAVTMFSLPENLPENHLELFNKYKAGGLDSVKDEPQIGWVGGRHLLETEINESTAVCGGMIYLSLRKAERKIPASLLKAVCKRDEQKYMHENQVARVPLNTRKGNQRKGCRSLSAPDSAVIDRKSNGDRSGFKNALSRNCFDCTNRPLYRIFCQDHRH
jgi:hypothetical protein